MTAAEGDDVNEEELWGAYRNAPTGQEKGKLRDPAQAVAVAKCLLHRLGFKGRHHPEPCTMCKIEFSRLASIYDEWMKWSGFDDPENKHTSLVMFESLPKEIQQQEVRKAQGYVRKVHQAPDRADGAESGAIGDVPQSGGQEVGGGGQQTAGVAPRTRFTGRTSSGVRRGQSEGGRDQTPPPPPPPDAG